MAAYLKLESIAVANICFNSIGLGLNLGLMLKLGLNIVSI